MTSERGFTLFELLVAGVFILTAIGVMLLLLRPQTYEAERNNAERRLGLAQIMQGINKYEADTGQLPPHITGEETSIGTEEDGTSLCDDLVPKYIDDLPSDPAGGLRLFENEDCTGEEQVYLTGYTARLDGAGNVVLAAPAAEKDETITIKRWFPLL